MPTQTQLSDYFKKKRGRPKGPAAPRKKKKKAAAKPAAKPKPPPAKQAPAKTTRTGWGTGENLKRMRAAVEGWDNNSEQKREAEGDMKRYAALVEIPYKTFQKYACTDKSKRRKLGGSVGRPSLVDKETAQTVVDTVRRRDRGNDGMSQKQVVDTLQELIPGLTRSQADNTFRRTIRPAHKKELTGIVKAQATTTKRTAITVRQQHRWHLLVNDAVARLNERNTGRCNVTGKPFSEVAHYFLVGGDETCLLASDGEVRIIGDKQKKKHEKRKEDSRMSITLYRTGSVAGNGPCAFLMAGQRRRPGFDDDFLMKHGAAAGSTLVMTESGFMTDDAWAKIAPKMIEGIRSMDIISGNPQWWVLKIVDGFGSHTADWKVMQLYADAKIELIKEEADSSHINQAYDKYVAKNDKRCGRALLDNLRRSGSSYTKGVLDQWHLVHVADLHQYSFNFASSGVRCRCLRRRQNDVFSSVTQVGIAMNRACKPETWAKSFEAVNLDLRSRQSFMEWCQRISSDLEAGDIFKPPQQEDGDPYYCLGPYWQGMSPKEKKEAVALFDEYKGWTPECVNRLQKDLGVPKSELMHVRLGVQLAKKYPAHLDRDGYTPTEQVVSPDVIEAEAAKKPITHGLRAFTLKPKGLKGLDLFNHMQNYARKHTAGERLEPSEHLDLAMSDVQDKLLNLTDRDMAEREILKDAGGAGAQMKLAQRKLDLAGDFKSFACVANNDERIANLKNAAMMASSIAEIDRINKLDKQKKKNDAEADLRAHAPGAFKKVQHVAPSGLTIKDIRAVLLVYYHQTTPTTIKKTTAVATLDQAIKQNPGGIYAAPDPSAVATSGSGDSSEEEEPSDDEE